MTNYLEFTPSVSWAKVRLGYEESYDSATKASTLTITSIEVMSTQYVTAYYVDGVLNINGEAVLSLVSAAGTALVEVKATNVWYPIVNASDLSAPLTAAVQIEGSETATIELTGNNFQRFAFYTIDEGSGNGWGVNESQTITLTVEEEPEEPVSTFDKYSFWLGVALGLAGKGLPAKKAPTYYLYNGVKLPALPEWDREMYPYAHILFNTNTEAYTLRAGTIHICYDDTLNTPKFRFTDCPIVEYEIDGNEWLLTEKASYGYSGVYGTQVTIVWTNEDIYNTDGDTMIFAASEPVPVYE